MAGRKKNFHAHFPSRGRPFFGGAAEFAAFDPGRVAPEGAGNSYGAFSIYQSRVENGRDRLLESSRPVEAPGGCAGLRVPLGWDVSHSRSATDTREFVYRVDAQNRLTSANAAWYDFARENGSQTLDRGSVMGCSLWNFIGDSETRHLFEIVFARVRQKGKPVTLSYRCDAPNLRRFMQLEIRPLPEAGIEFSSRILRQEARPRVALLDDTAGRADTFLTICAWCKKVALPDETWVEVEQAVERLNLFEGPILPRISHGVCPACMGEVERTLELL